LNVNKTGRLWRHKLLHCLVHWVVMFIVRANDGIHYIVVNEVSFARGRAVLIVASSEFVSVSSKRCSFEFNWYGRKVNELKAFRQLEKKRYHDVLWCATMHPSYPCLLNPRVAPLSYATRLSLTLSSKLATLPDAHLTISRREQ